MMQNVVLLKSSVGQAYYSRQLYMYLFGVVVHRESQSQQKDDIHLYIWQENENKKDSHMIASALMNCLQHQLHGPLRQASTLRLFSDSCYGPNKNMNVISMLQSLCSSSFRNLNIEYAFQIRGHSFLLAELFLAERSKFCGKLKLFS